ncbi:hypothetical protein N7450_007669 [Penicillium hetheringtonii]|uniref:Hemerythrin-like domain-containing protein n=1 Tax=Penicillium hetheringtonii TaxID=911720 RepID=A0AAD6GRR5_9EURO|nr:hypothetical protein N7450_007669 [Penicillium hetheringtonii]
MSLLFSRSTIVPSKLFRFSTQRRNISKTAMTAGISDTIKKDHREIENLYHNILTSSTDKEKIQWQNQFTWELARHSIGEELVVYPQFEKKLSDGQKMADKDRQEHLSVKEQLKAFQNMQPSDPQFESTVKTLMVDLSQHIKEEESDDLPKLEASLTTEESEKLSQSFGRTKIFVPSRSHPSAPDKPLFETVIGLMTAPIDHLADLFRTWPHTSGMPNPSTK